MYKYIKYNVPLLGAAKIAHRQSLHTHAYIYIIIPQTVYSHTNTNPLDSITYQLFFFSAYPLYCTVLSLTTAMTSFAILYIIIIIIYYIVVSVESRYYIYTLTCRTYCSSNTTEKIICCFGLRYYDAIRGWVRRVSKNGNRSIYTRKDK